MRAEASGAAVLARAGAWGAQARLEPADTLIGTVCDGEPLFETERALFAAEPNRVLAGLGAALLATGARRGFLAVRGDWPDALAAAHAATRGSVITVRTVEPFYPADELLALELGPGLGRTCVLGTQALHDLGLAAQGRPILRRWVTIAGAVADPRIVVVPLGTPIDQVVTDATSLAWVAMTGALRGALRDADDVVDGTAGGLLVLPVRHGLVARRRLRLTAQLRRARSACIDCRLCTDACPHALAGAPLEPHRALRELFHPGARTSASPAAKGALFCTACGVCDVVCPSGLAPGALYQALRERLAAQGLTAPPLEAPAAPHPDRPYRRLPLDLLTRRLGLGSFARPRRVDRAPLAPRSVRLPLPSGLPRAANTQSGRLVALGEPLAPGLFASISGRIAEIADGVIEIHAD